MDRVVSVMQARGMRDLGMRELDHLWAGVRLEGVPGRAPPRGCRDPAGCGGEGGGPRRLARAWATWGSGELGGVHRCGGSWSSDLGECAGSVGRSGRMGRIPLSVAEHDRSAEGGAGAQGGGSNSDE